MLLRAFIVALAVSLCSCGKKEPPPAEVELDDVRDQLERVQSRLDELETNFESKQKADAAPSEGAAEPAPTQAPTDAMIEMPRASTGGEVTSTVSLRVTKAGLRMGDKPVTDAEFDERVKALLREHPQLGLVIQADPEVPHADVVEVLDRARALGVTRYALGTPAEPSRPAK